MRSQTLNANAKSKIVTMLSEGSISLDQAEKFMEERNYE